jgi:hypothetical protein
MKYNSKMSVFINHMGYNTNTTKTYRFKKCKDITNIELLVYKIQEIYKSKHCFIY